MLVTPVLSCKYVNVRPGGIIVPSGLYVCLKQEQ